MVAKRHDPPPADDAVDGSAQKVPPTVGGYPMDPAMMGYPPMMAGYPPPHDPSMAMMMAMSGYGRDPASMHYPPQSMDPPPEGAVMPASFDPSMMAPPAGMPPYPYFHMHAPFGAQFGGPLDGPSNRPRSQACVSVISREYTVDEVSSIQLRESAQSREGPSESVASRRLGRPWTEVNKDVSSRMLAAASDSPPMIPKRDYDERSTPTLARNAKPSQQTDGDESDDGAGGGGTGTAMRPQRSGNNSEHSAPTGGTLVPYRGRQLFDPMMMMYPPPFGHPMMPPPPPPGMFGPPPPPPMMPPPMMVDAETGMPIMMPIDPGVLFTPFGPVHPSELNEKRHHGRKRSKAKASKRSKSLDRLHPPPPFMMPPPPFMGHPFGPPPPPPPPEMVDGDHQAMVPYVPRPRSAAPPPMTLLPFENGNGAVGIPQMYGAHVTKNGATNSFYTSKKNGKLSIADSVDKSVSSTTKLNSGKTGGAESACYVLCCKGFAHVIWVIMGIILVGLILGLVLGLTLV